jgi:endoglycosylceramidase
MRSLSILAATTAATAVAQVTGPCEGQFSIDPVTLNYRDQCGRQRFFRGSNVVVKNDPFYPDNQIFNPGWSLTPGDGALYQSLGWNIVRLGVMWSGVEPAGRGQINSTYLQKLIDASNTMAEYGVYSLLDAHQDVFSPYICGDGAPMWVGEEYSAGAPGFPEPLAPARNRTGGPSGPITDCGGFPWSEFYFTNSVGQAFQTLYTTDIGRSDFSRFWSAVVEAFTGPNGAGGPGGPAVVSYELLNEPWSGDVLKDPLLLVPGVADAVNLQPFYENVTSAIRAAEARVGASPKVVMVESITFDDFVSVGFSSIPGAEQGLGALSWHYYILPNFNDEWQISSRMNDASRLKSGSMLSEFDIGLASPVTSPYTNMDLRHMLDLCDAYGESYIGWAYSNLFNGTGLYWPDVVELSRPFPLAVAGVVEQYLFVVNGSATQGPFFNLTYYLSPQVNPYNAETVVFVSTEVWFGANMQVEVASNPPGLVQYRIEWHNATNATNNAYSEEQQQNDPQDPVAPQPLAYAHIIVTALSPVPVNATLQDSVVSVVVTADPMPHHSNGGFRGPQ